MTEKTINIQSLFSLLSYIVAPVRKVMNKHCSFSSAFSTNPTITSYPSNIEIYSINNGKSRECSAISNKCSSRKSLILSNASSISYHKRIEINNKLSKEDSTDPVNSFYLSYARTVKVSSLVSLATDKKMANNSQHVNNKMPKPHGNSKGK